jgi:FkbM family methyltransferase
MTVYDRKAYIEETPARINELLRLFRPGDPLVIFDVGACESEDSIRYSRLFPNARVYAFEPLPSNAAKARELLREYGADHVTLVELALSDRKGSATFHVSSGTPPDIDAPKNWNFGNKSSSLLPPHKHLEMASWIEFKETITVQTARGRDFCRDAGLPRVDFMHMDVQGAELKVLAGFELPRFPVGAIWLEVSLSELYAGQPLLPEVVAYMRKAGFLLYHLDLPGEQGDALFVHWKLLLRHPGPLARFLMANFRHLLRKVFAR